MNEHVVIIRGNAYQLEDGTLMVADVFVGDSIGDWCEFAFDLVEDNDKIFGLKMEELLKKIELI